MRTRPALFLIALAASPGCGDKKTGDAQSAATDSASTTASVPAAARTGCDWITEAEASTALGGAAKYRSNDPGSSNCILDGVEGPGGATVSVDFSVKEGNGSYSYQSSRAGAEKLSGLGDQAVWVPGGSMMGQIDVVKGTRDLSATISSTTGKATDLRDKAIAFARVVVEKM